MKLKDMDVYSLKKVYINGTLSYVRSYDNTVWSKGKELKYTDDERIPDHKICDMLKSMVHDTKQWKTSINEDSIYLQKISGKR